MVLGGRLHQRTDHGHANNGCGFLACGRAGVGFCVWATLADCRGRGSGISGIAFGSSGLTFGSSGITFGAPGIAFGSEALAMTRASCSWLALSRSVSVWLSRAIWIWVALIWSMILLLRATSSRL